MDEILAELARFGVVDLTIGYGGGGDEGYIHEMTTTPYPLAVPDEMARELEEWAYSVLENHHPGWEINEGSDGHILINVAERKATLNHNENVITQTTTSVEVKI